MHSAALAIKPIVILYSKQGLDKNMFTYVYIPLFQACLRGYPLSLLKYSCQHLCQSGRLETAHSSVNKVSLTSAVVGLWLCTIEYHMLEDSGLNPPAIQAEISICEQTLYNWVLRVGNA